MVKTYPSRTMLFDALCKGEVLAVFMDQRSFVAQSMTRSLGQSVLVENRVFEPSAATPIVPGRPSSRSIACANAASRS